MDIVVKICDLPPRVKAFTRANSDGSYTIVLNDQLCFDAQRAAFMEEMRHITGGDFDRLGSAGAIESMRHACGE